VIPFRLFIEDSGLTIDDIADRLNKIGFDSLKRDSGRTISILTDGNRIDALKKAEAEFSNEKAVYDPNKGSSSVGAVSVGMFTIKARPASKQGKRSAGLENEDEMINGIKTFTKSGPMNVTITDGKRSKTYEDVVDVEEVGRDTSNRKKADVRLVLKNGTKIPISIKKDNAEMWESADSYWAATAKKIVDRMEANGEITVEKKGLINKITPNLGVKANNKEKKAVVFGSDLLGKGFVVVKTFSSGDFKLSKDGDHVVVKVTKIIDRMNDLKGTSDIFFLIRNDSSRKGSKIRPGLRVLAVSATRINRNVKVVER